MWSSAEAVSAFSTISAIIIKSAKLCLSPRARLECTADISDELLTCALSVVFNCIQNGKKYFHFHTI